MHAYLFEGEIYTLIRNKVLIGQRQKNTQQEIPIRKHSTILKKIKLLVSSTNLRVLENKN